MPKITEKSQSVFGRAKESCLKSGHNLEDHFEDILEMVEIDSGAKRERFQNLNRFTTVIRLPRTTAISTKPAGLIPSNSMGLKKANSAHPTIRNYRMVPQ